MSNRLRNLALQTAVLVMFVLSGSGVLPCLLGALAKLDGGHTVGVRQADGMTVIVLGHDSETENRVPLQLAGHNHSKLADLVLTFGASGEREGDHLIAFAQSAASREREGQRVTPPLFVPLLLVETPSPVAPSASVADLSPLIRFSSTAHLRSVVLRV